jgi:hypothetical protein
MSDESQMDWDNAIKQAPKKSRAIVSVSFSREDFDRIDQQAERLRVTLSEYIRSAALTRVSYEEMETAGGLSAGTYYAPEPRINVTSPSPSPTHPTMNVQRQGFTRRVA